MTAVAIAPDYWIGLVAANYPDFSNSQLVEASKRGEREAFSELVRRHREMAYKVACRFMHDPVLAEDLTQEACLKAFRLIGGFRGDCRFSTWFYRVTTSVCLTELNRRKRRNEVPLQANHIAAVGCNDVETREMAELVRKCVGKLSGRYEKIVTLYYLHQEPYEQIAREMDVPIGTLKTWMYRARKELREGLEQELSEPAVH